MSANFQNGSLYSKKIEKKENPEKIMRMKHQNHHILQSNHTSNLILKLIVQLITSILPFYMKAGKNIIQMLDCFFKKKKKKSSNPKSIAPTTPNPFQKLLEDEKKICQYTKKFY